jgi:hypothetical protein
MSSTNLFQYLPLLQKQEVVSESIRELDVTLYKSKCKLVGKHLFAL